MEFIVQVAGLAHPGKIPELKAQFRQTRGLLTHVRGFVKAEALVNHNTLQIQILYRFDEVDHAMKFVKDGMLAKALDPYRSLVHSAHTLVISVVEDVIA